MKSMGVRYQKKCPFIFLGIMAVTSIGFLITLNFTYSQSAVKLIPHLIFMKMIFTKLGFNIQEIGNRKMNIQTV